MHSRILTDAQRRLLRAACPWVANQGFYLAGGTAVALFLGHRESVDLDWFGEDPIRRPRDLIEHFEAVSGTAFRASVAEPGTIVGFADGVKVSFLHMPVPLLRPRTRSGKCLVASLDDLAAMKLLAIAQRGTKRDFVDLHALLDVYSLADMIPLFLAKYPGGSVRHLVQALAFFDDAEGDPMPRILVRTTWASVKRRISAEVQAFCRPT